MAADSTAKALEATGKESKACKGLKGALDRRMEQIMVEATTGCPPYKAGKVELNQEGPLVEAWAVSLVFLNITEVLWEAAQYLALLVLLSRAEAAWVVNLYHQLQVAINIQVQVSEARLDLSVVLLHIISEASQNIQLQV